MFATFFTEKLKGLYNQPPLGLPLEKAPALTVEVAQRSGVLNSAEGVLRRPGPDGDQSQLAPELQQRVHVPLNSMRPASCSFTNPSVRTYLFLHIS